MTHVKIMLLYFGLMLQSVRVFHTRLQLCNSGHNPLLTVPPCLRSAALRLFTDTPNNLFFFCDANCSTMTADPALGHRWSPETIEQIKP